MLIDQLIIVFLAAFVTDLATGLGVIPFFFVEDFSGEWLVGLWGLASGIMLTASIIGLLPEGIAAGQEYPVLGSAYTTVGIGVLAGILLVVIASRVIDDTELNPGTFEQASFTKMVLILGILTVHSFPEGVAIGVAFAELGLETGYHILGATIPPIAVTMTIAISIHNIPEGTSIAIPFRAMGAGNWAAVGAAVFSSLPQPIGAVVAYLFVTQAKAFLPFGYGFAGGAMIYLVLTEFVEEAFEEGESLPYSGWPSFIYGGIVGTAQMIILFILL